MHISHNLALAAALGCAVLSSAADAQIIGPSAYGSEAAHQTVRFGDLDLTTDAGAKRLAFRIRVAAQTVCDGAIANVRFGTGFDGCVKTAIQQAAAQLKNPMLDAQLGLTPDGAVYARNR
jgi:UrcA family protein